MRSAIMASLCLLTAATIGAVLPGSAAADPVADKSRVVTTRDGWQIRVTKTAENLDRVPNLAGTPFTREGFVSVEADADIVGHGRQPVRSGSVTLGYQIGCQVDVSNGLTLGISSVIGPNIGVSVTPTPGLNLGASALAVPSLSATLKPGTITDVPFGTKALTGRTGSIATDQVQIKVDSCLGPVSLRSYAIVDVSTATADNSVAVYGDPIWL